MNKAIISVGSNIDPEQNIEAAEQILRQEQEFITKSAFVKTLPQGFTAQAEFINGAFFIKTECEFQELKDYLKDVESRLGRVRTHNKNGPRTIDLDVIVFNGEVLDDDFHKYDFVRDAVLEIMEE